MSDSGGIIGGLLKFGVKMAQWAADDAAFQEQSAIQSQEWNRARIAAEAQAADALTRGASQAGRVRLQAGQLEGQQRVAYALSGVDASSGSAASTINSSRLFSELDAATVQNNAAREALGYRRVIQGLETQAKAARANATARETGRTLDMIGSFLDAIPKGGT